MTAVDTNVMVRFLVRDDEKQARAVYHRLKEAEKTDRSFLVPLVSLVETIWVLESAYGKERSQIVDAIDDMRRMPVFEFQMDEAVEKMIANAPGRGADLADLLIAFSAQFEGSQSGITFDQKAAKLNFFTLLEAET